MAYKFNMPTSSYDSTKPRKFQLATQGNAALTKPQNSSSSNGGTSYRRNPLLPSTSSIGSVSSSSAPVLSSVTAPTQKSLSSYLSELEGTGLLTGPETISGMDNSYYQNIFDTSSKRLKDQFFNNDDSATNQFTNTMVKRGMLGSGIESGGLQSIYQDFGSQLSDVETQLANMKMQNDYDTSKYNADAKSAYNEKVLGALFDRSRDSTDFDTKIFDSQVEAAKADREFAADETKSRRELLANILEQINSTRENKMINADQRTRLGADYEDLINQLLGG